MEAHVMQATTRAAILRGTTEDDFGQTVDTDTPLADADDFPASIIEVDDSVFDPADSTWRTVRVLRGRVPAYLTILDGDRLRDNHTGDVFIIDEVQRARRSIAGRASVTLTLRRTGP
jgi:hypothetical protein